VPGLMNLNLDVHHKKHESRGSEVRFAQEPKYLNSRSSYNSS